MPAPTIDTGLKMLFSQIAEGDETAFGTLFNMYAPRLQSYITGLTRSDAIAEELVQDTFISVWLSRDKLETIENGNAWIYKMAANKTYTWLNRRATEGRILDEIHREATEQKPSEQVLFNEMKNAIHQAIQSLTDRRRQVYRLHREEGLTSHQIAGQLGISHHTAKNLLKDAVADIRGFLTKRGFLMLAVLFFLKD